MAMQGETCWTLSTSKRMWKWPESTSISQIRIGCIRWARPKTPRAMSLNEREITAARSRGSNLGLSSIRALPPESGVLGFQAGIDTAEGDLEASLDSAKRSAAPQR